MSMRDNTFSYRSMTPVHKTQNHKTFYYENHDKIHTRPRQRYLTQELRLGHHHWKVVHMQQILLPSIQVVLIPIPSYNLLSSTYYLAASSQALQAVSKKSHTLSRKCPCSSHQRRDTSAKWCGLQFIPRALIWCLFNSRNSHFQVNILLRAGFLQAYK